jgi:hypothetical protein
MIAKRLLFVKIIKKIKIVCLCFKKNNNKSVRYATIAARFVFFTLNYVNNNFVFCEVSPG